jgi:hypothetical protein
MPAPNPNPNPNPKAKFNNYNPYYRPLNYQEEKQKKAVQAMNHKVAYRVRSQKGWPPGFHPGILEEWPLEIARELPWACISSSPTPNQVI